MKNIIHIKNMVCPRCIESVKETLNDLQIEISHIKLGEINLVKSLSENQKKQLDGQLRIKGFELLQDKTSRMIGQVKAIVIEQIHHKERALDVNFSNLIANKLNREYGSISRLFSSVEGITIERFIVKQKIERVKELVSYNEKTLSEIAFEMNYSSVAYLSSQFKKETGMTPTQFKVEISPNRKPLDTI